MCYTNNICTFAEANGRSAVDTIFWPCTNNDRGGPGSCRESLPNRAFIGTKGTATASGCATCRSQVTRFAPKTAPPPTPPCVPHAQVSPSLPVTHPICPCHTQGNTHTKITSTRPRLLILRLSLVLVLVLERVAPK